MSARANKGETTRPTLIAAMALGWDCRILEDLSAGLRTQVTLTRDLRIVRTRRRGGKRIEEVMGVQREGGERSIDEAMRRLKGDMPGLRRLAVEAEPSVLRECACRGWLDEIRITWRPRMAGGTGTGPITGSEAGFLPVGIEYDLVSMRRAGAECIARYRVQSGCR